MEHFNDVYIVYDVNWLFTHGLWNNELPKFEQGRGAVTTLIFTKIVSNVDLKPLTILAKRSTIDAWLVPEHASAGGYTVKFSLTTCKGDIILMNTLHLKFRLINCLSIRWPLKQLSKVSLLWCSQEHLFGKFYANCYQGICGSV